MKKFLSKKYLFILPALLLIIPVGTFAALRLQVDYPEFGGIDINNLNFDDPNAFSNFLLYIYYLILGIGGLATFIMLLWGGFRWLASAGNPSAIGEARDILSSAIIGLVILLASYIILNTINPNLVSVQLGVQPIIGPAVRDINADGVYLCDGDNCSAAWRRTRTNITSICDEVPPLQDSSPAGDTICGQVGSIRINGRYAVKLYENKYFEGKNICFNSNVGTLDAHLIAHANGWNQDADSVEVLPENGCKSPGLTMPASGNGVYVCDDEGCLSGKRLLTNNVSNICDGNQAEGSVDLICGQIGSLAINGDWNVRLYEDSDYKGRRVCFTKSIYALDCYSIGTSGWNQDADSVEVLTPGACKPQDAGVTYDADGVVISTRSTSASCQDLFNRGFIE